jgi:predicted TIM-barrel fold metal-dependent hydrolase
VTCLRKGYGHESFFPIYEEACKLDMPLAIHGAPSRGLGFDFFDTFVEVHALEHPRMQYLEDIPGIEARADISDSAKRKILADNARRFYRLKD